jgi:ribonuclease I
VDNLSIFLFAIAGISTLVGAFYLMYSAASSKPVRDYNAGRLTGTWTTEVKKPVHPEMRDVEPGTELMGVNFQQKTSCDLEEYQDLQARINKLREELEGDEEDDDDDGGDVVALRR